MIDKDRLKYIVWEACGARAEGHRHVARRVLAEGRQDQVPEAGRGVGAERGGCVVGHPHGQGAEAPRLIALAMADLITREAHEERRSDLVSAYLRAPPSG